MITNQLTSTCLLYLYVDYYDVAAASRSCSDHANLVRGIHKQRHDISTTVISRYIEINQSAVLQLQKYV